VGVLVSVGVGVWVRVRVFVGERVWVEVSVGVRVLVKVKVSVAVLVNVDVHKGLGQPQGVKVRVGGTFGGAVGFSFLLHDCRNPTARMATSTTRMKRFM
jgi:hypothetical protein